MIGSERSQHTGGVIRQITRTRELRPPIEIVRDNDVRHPFLDRSTVCSTGTGRVIERLTQQVAFAFVDLAVARVERRRRSEPEQEIPPVTGDRGEFTQSCVEGVILVVYLKRSLERTGRGVNITTLDETPCAITDHMREVLPWRESCRTGAQAGEIL